MNYLVEHPDKVAIIIGQAMFWFLGLYFLVWAGLRFGDDKKEQDLEFWFVVFINVSGLVLGILILGNKNIIGYLFLIPFSTFIITSIIDWLDFDYKQKKQAKGIIFSSIASILTYIFTHSLFGFGMSEASISSVIVAATLGMIGYRS